MKRFDSYTHSVTSIILGGLACAAVAGENNYTVDRSSIDAGGATRSSADGYELSSTLGQSEGGVLTGNGYELNAGFRYPLLPTDCDEDGMVSPTDYYAFELCLTGPGGFLPEECACNDADASGAIDLRDFARAQAAYSGSPNQ